MMTCPNCGAPVSEDAASCPNCGAWLQEEAVQPYDYPQDPPHPAQPLPGMILGIVSCVLAFIGYLAIVVSAASGRGTALVVVLLVIPALALAVGSLILSITGLKNSIRTGGRKYVKGIVFSAIGISFAAAALLFVLITVFIGILFASITSRYF